VIRDGDGQDRGDGGSCAERGTVKFTPNAKAKDTNNLRLIQVVKTTTAGPSAPDFSWIVERPGAG